MSWICDFLQFFNCQGFLEANTELLVEVCKPQREFVVEKQVAKDNFLVRKVSSTGDCFDALLVEIQETSRARILLWPSLLLRSASSGFVHLLPHVWQVPQFDGDLEQNARAEYELGLQAWNLRQAEQGLELFLRSAQKGHEVGEYCFRYGMYHELPPADIQQAFRWYRRGARMNHPKCTTMLGKLHMAVGHRDDAIHFLQKTGRPNAGHVVQMEDEWRTLSEDLAGSVGGERGDSLAQWFLGELFLQSAKLRDAVKWWKLSADNGDSDAMMRLSQVLREGAIGVPQEPMLARHWLLAAAAHGHKDALDRVNWAVETQRSHSTNEGSDKSRNHSGSSDGSFAFFLQAAADWEMEDDGLPKRDKEAEERARRALEEEEKRLDRRCAQNAARAEAERRRTALEMLEGERAVARFLKQHGFEGVNCPKKNMLGRYQYPLHKASELGNARLIRMLLREGAIPQNLDSSGRTPLVVAERRNRNGSHMKVIQSLTCPSAAASPNDRYLL
eukprot:symbB.v1.2.011996.t3/scaffold815.1/size160196/7